MQRFSAHWLNHNAANQNLAHIFRWHPICEGEWSSRQGMRRKFVGSEIKWSWPFRVKHEGSKTQFFSNTCKETCQMYPNVFKCPDLLLSLSLYVCVKSEWTDFTWILSLALDHHAAVFEGGDSVAAGRSAKGAELRIHKDLSWNESSKTIISAATILAGSLHSVCGWFIGWFAVRLPLVCFLVC